MQGEKGSLHDLIQQRRHTRSACKGITATAAAADPDGDSLPPSPTSPMAISPSEERLPPMSALHKSVWKIMRNSRAAAAAGGSAADTGSSTSEGSSDEDSESSSVNSSSPRTAKRLKIFHAKVAKPTTSIIFGNHRRRHTLCFTSDSR